MKKNVNSDHVWKVATGLYALLIISLSLMRMPASKAPSVPNIDKLAHFCVYAIFAALLYRALRPRHIKGMPRISALLLATLFGVLAEILQLEITQYRTFSYADMLANLLGAGFAVGIIGLLNGKQARRFQRE